MATTPHTEILQVKSEVRLYGISAAVDLSTMGDMAAVRTAPSPVPSDSGKPDTKTEAP